MINIDKINDILLKCQKPARYVGGERGQVIKDLDKIDVRVAFCFPDIYDIGMSHLGMRLLYSVLNEQDFIWCERAFMPWSDFQSELISNDIALYTLESKTPLNEFDIIMFTLQYEMCYTTVLKMMSLGKIPVFSKDRKGLENIVVAGGPCAYNPEPMADFIDIFSIGEGEEHLCEISKLYQKAKKENWTKIKFLKEAAKIEGTYVPALYNVEYNDDNTIKSFEPICDEAPKKVKKRIIKDFDNTYFLKNQIVPYTEVVHDRVTIELFRGCIRGCRFCQAGMLFRPIRTKSVDTLVNDAKLLLENTGYEELSLCSLSSSDYPYIEELIDKLLTFTEQKRVRLSLPSLRIDNFSKELATKISSVKKSTFTFAPEAGSQRLRDAINKNVTFEDIEKSLRVAFENKSSSVKLYFMMGLPTETDDDIVAINSLCDDVLNIFFSIDKSKRNRYLNLSVSVSSFIPKPFTPFQWEAQDTYEIMRRKQEFLRGKVNHKKINLSYSSVKMSNIEALLARGDRRLCKVIYSLFLKGVCLEAWTENFSFKLWEETLEKQGIDIKFYAMRKRPFDEILPWDFIDIGVKKEFLISEAKKAYEGKTTKSCKENCSGCGANKLIGGACDV